MLEIGLKAVFMPVGLRLIEHSALKALGQKFKIREMARVVMGVLVPVGIPEFIHEFGRSIPQIQRNGRGLVLGSSFECGTYGHIG